MHTVSLNEHWERAVRAFTTATATSAKGALRLGIDSKVGVRYAKLKYSVGEELPTLDEVRGWTAQVRAAAAGGPLDNGS